MLSQQRLAHTGGVMARLLLAFLRQWLVLAKADEAESVLCPSVNPDVTRATHCYSASLGDLFIRPVIFQLFF